MSLALNTEDAEPLPPLPQDDRLAQLLAYAGETRQDGAALSDDPNRQQLLMEACINSRLAALFRVRDAWMKATGRELTYHAAQTRRLERRNAARLAEISRVVVGMYALLDANDPRAPSHGGFELAQRLSVAEAPPETAVAGDAAIIASALGLGSQPAAEVAAPAP